MILNLKECALCGASTKLELSHIVPKMAFKSLKRSAVGNIRSTHNPNITIQDSEKYYMLCSACEDLFNVCETEFSKLIFHPYLKKEADSFSYDERLFYYITSVSWRSLYLDLIDFVQNHVVGIEALECLINSERIMREYLLKKRTDIEKIENHIFFFDDVVNVSGCIDGVKISDLRPNTTFHRGISSYTFCYEKEKTYGTITNMLGIVLITLYRLGVKEEWINTNIVNGKGTIAAKKQHITSVVGNEFNHIMISTQKAFEKMSEAQKYKINERIKNAGEDIKDFAVYSDWIKDKEIQKKQ